MPLLKHGAVVEDRWRRLADDAPPPGDEPVIVSLARLRADRALAGRNRPLGLALKNIEPVHALAGELDRFDLIALEFPKFTDGRAYTQARILRERLGFTGELRATGQVLPDQLLFMQRCGFDAFEIAKGEPVEAWRKALASFSVFYQPTGDGRAPADALRRYVGSHAGNFSRAAEALVTGDAELAALAALAEATDAQGFLAAALGGRFAGRTAVVTSFGAESAVLLHLVASVDRGTPVIFLETGKLFAETLAYRDLLIERLGLTDVRSIEPDSAALLAADPAGDLWRRDPDRCCHLRKIEPLERALKGFAAWINGRKRYQSETRGALPLVERVAGRIKLNPLAHWTPEQINDYFARHRLPRHPLEAEGYRSIGCAPCTTPVGSDEDARAGRWRDSEKTECGIHFIGGRIVRTQTT
jgi:phosphoadenylyl-sulfate reductase (thioredoxin)